ncbi:MAG: aspartate carbamoyltransferase regulatory subunit [Thermoprotei archaeon]|nr:MAG: aspartate carbamoyltransferase regulatory subunit [Thermoprotei archaeon]
MNLGEPSSLTVSKIRNGTVIDHIPAGKALLVLRILGITGREGLRTAVLMNVESKKLGRKDIIKIEGRELTSDEVNVIALVAPSATINIIRNYTVYKKLKVTIPQEIRGFIRCPNPTCITNRRREGLVTRFRVVKREPLTLQCVYCGTMITQEELEDLISM